MARSRRDFRISSALAVAVSLAVAIFSNRASADVTVPDTPAGHMFQMWLAAFDSGDPATIQSFYAVHMPQPLAAGAVNFSKMTGGVDLLDIRSGGPSRIVFRVKDRATPRVGVGFLILKEPASPKVESFNLRAIPPKAEMIGLDVDAQTRERVIGGVTAALNDNYVDPAVAKNMELDIRSRLSKGEFDTVTDGPTFASKLTLALRSISHDKHLGVDFIPAKLPPPAPPSAEEQEQMRRSLLATHCAFQPAEHLSGKIGLLKFDGFPPRDLCAEAASSAVNSLGDVNAIIFDLRDNGGGDPAMVAYIASYLFSDRTHITDTWTRKTDQTREFWTSPDAPGARYAKQPVFILTSARTFSGAEDFSYSLQALKRAVIVGETTGGGAHPVSGQPVADGFVAMVPFAKTVNPITHGNWEGTGVEPNVKVTASEALATAQKLAAESLRTKHQ